MSNLKCIFHIPGPFSDSPKSGSALRPLMMLNAFRQIGYQVTVISGYGTKRKKLIENIKKEIENGIQYEFLYSESSTMPTALTEKDHFPRHPWLDFNFFSYCQNKGIKVGLFYRDIYWKFPIYKENVPLLKRMISIPLYKFDLRNYKKRLSVCYVPSMKFAKTIGVPLKYKPLPPGSNLNENFLREKRRRIETFERKQKLKIFYVGGVAGLYDITGLMDAVCRLDNVELTVCCQEEEWNANKQNYQSFSCDRIKVIHESGEGLKPYYMEADVSSLYFKKDEYRSFAMPMKLFEYISYGVPIIATKGTVAQEFISKEEIGWTIDYDVNMLMSLLTKLCEKGEEVQKKSINCIQCAYKNSWEERAKEVVSDLQNKKSETVK